MISYQLISKLSLAGEKSDFCMRWLYIRNLFHNLVKRKWERKCQKDDNLIIELSSKFVKMSDSEDSFEATFEVESDPLRVHPEHCKVNASQIHRIGREIEQQVRIEFPAVRGDLGAIYTISSHFLNDQGRLILGNRIKNLDSCQQSDGACYGKVISKIMVEGLDDPKEAETRGEFVEILTPDFQNKKLIVIAPHGGEIEPWTDIEAEYVAEQFSSNIVSLWQCKGFSSQGREDAYERWHITSTQINPESFPKLKSIIAPTPNFEYSVAFHGWTEDSICVGGNPANPDITLIEDIRAAIKAALENENSDIVVNVPPCPRKFNGDRLENIVNRLGINGVQIEQCKIARSKYHEVIASAVADVIGTRITV